MTSSNSSDDKDLLTTGDEAKLVTDDEEQLTTDDEKKIMTSSNKLLQIIYIPQLATTDLQPNHNVSLDS